MLAMYVFMLSRSLSSFHELRLWGLLKLIAVALVFERLVSRLRMGKMEEATHVNIADTNTPRHDCGIEESQ